MTAVLHLDQIPSRSTFDSFRGTRLIDEGLRPPIGNICDSVSSLHCSEWIKCSWMPSVCSAEISFQAFFYYYSQGLTPTKQIIKNVPCTARKSVLWGFFGGGLKLLWEWVCYFYWTSDRCHFFSFCQQTGFFFFFLASNVAVLGIRPLKHCPTVPNWYYAVAHLLC